MSDNPNPHTHHHRSRPRLSLLRLPQPRPEIPSDHETAAGAPRRLTAAAGVPRSLATVVRHRRAHVTPVGALLATVAMWLIAAAAATGRTATAVVRRRFAPLVLAGGTWAANRYRRMAGRLAASRAGRIVATATRHVRCRVVRPIQVRLAPLSEYVNVRFGRYAGPAAVAALVLVLAGLAMLGGTLGPTQSVGINAVEQSILPGRSSDRAARAARTPSTPPTSPASPAPTSRPPSPPPNWSAPMPGAPVTSCFGMRWGLMHQGIDFALPPGTPVRAVGKGTVVGAGWLYTGYGISVVIDHGNGYLSHYAHLQRVAVRPGQKVRPTQIIGYEGSTGDSTGPHLHFEIHRGMWHQVDPAPVLRRWGVPVHGC